MSILSPVALKLVKCPSYFLMFLTLSENFFVSNVIPPPVSKIKFPSIPLTEAFITICPEGSISIGVCPNDRIADVNKPRMQIKSLSGSFHIILFNK